MMRRLSVVRTPEQVAIAEVREEDGRKLAATRAYTSKQRAKRLLRTVPWADPAAIKAFYDEAERLTRETGITHEVDHIIPLVGRRVSGLHIETNLRVITKAENRAKSNHFEDVVGDAGVEPATFRV